MYVMVKQKGQTLVEMIVVVGVIVLLTTGIVAGTTASLSRTEALRVRSEALTHTQTGIELARKIRDDGWNAFWLMGSAGGTVYCVNSAGVWSGAPCGVNIDGIFTRSVTLQTTSSPGEPTMIVTSNVIWGDIADPSNDVQLKTYLTQWK